MSIDQPNVSSAMSKDELERHKLVVERRKLLVELRQLQLSWWQKPAYIGVVLPTLLAFGTLSIAFFTGYFQNEHKLIEIRRERAAEQERDLNKSVSDLTTQKVKLELDYSNKKKELDEKGNQATKDIQKIDLDRVALMVEAQTKRQEFIDKTQALEADFKNRSAVIASQLKQRQDELEAAKTSLAKSEIREVLSRVKPDILYRSDGLQNNIPNAVEFLADKKGDTQLYRTALQEMAEQEDENQDIFLAILYKVTGNQKWKSDLFQLARKQIRISGLDLVISNMRTLHLLGVYRMGPIFSAHIWDENDRREIIDLMFEILEMSDIDNLNINSAYLVLSGLYDPARFTRRIEPGQHVQGYLTALKKVRDQALDRKWPEAFRLGAFDFLARLSPQCYLIVIGNEVVSQNRDENIVKDIFGKSMATRDGYQRVQSDHPRTSDASSWRKWLESNSRIVTLYMEGNLETLRARPELLKAQ